MGATRASGRARLAAARLRTRRLDPVSRRLLVRRLAFAPRAVRIGGVILFALGLGAALSPLMRLRRPAARDVLARLDRDAKVSHRPASSLADFSPTTMAIRSRRPSGRPIGRGLSAKSRPFASRPPRPAWPRGTLTRSASAWRCSPSRRRSSPDPRCTVASSTLSTGAATRLSRRWRRAASTHGSTRRPMPANRRWSSISRRLTRRR